MADPRRPSADHPHRGGPGRRLEVAGVAGSAELAARLRGEAAGRAQGRRRAGLPTRPGRAQPRRAAHPDLGVVIDDLSNPWYVALLDGLRPVLHEHGLRPLLADGRTEPDAVQALSDLRVDGLVLVGTPSASAVDQVNALGNQIPTVVAGTREPRLSAVDVVANDDYHGGQLATTAPAGAGSSPDRPHHRRGRGGSPAPCGLRGGDRRRRPRPQCVAGDWTEATGRLVGHAELSSSPDRPTAIFAANDLSAVGVLAAADELGLRVPEDLSVVGYDNSVFARCTGCR